MLEDARTTLKQPGKSRIWTSPGVSSRNGSSIEKLVWLELKPLGYIRQVLTQGLIGGDWIVDFYHQEERHFVEASHLGDLPGTLAEKTIVKVLRLGEAINIYNQNQKPPLNSATLILAGPGWFLKAPCVERVKKEIEYYALERRVHILYRPDLKCEKGNGTYSR